MLEIKQFRNNLQYKLMSFTRLNMFSEDILQEFQEGGSPLKKTDESSEGDQNSGASAPSSDHYKHTQPEVDQFQISEWFWVVDMQVFIENKENGLISKKQRSQVQNWPRLEVNQQVDIQNEPNQTQVVPDQIKIHRRPAKDNNANKVIETWINEIYQKEYGKLIKIRGKQGGKGGKYYLAFQISFIQRNWSLKQCFNQIKNEFPVLLAQKRQSLQNQPLYVKQLQLRAIMAEDFVSALLNGESIEVAMKKLYKKGGQYFQSACQNIRDYRMSLGLPLELSLS